MPAPSGCLRAFLTPTVLHFAAVLITCVVVIVPSHSSLSLCIVLAVGSMLRLSYSLRVWVRARQPDFEIDRRTRAFARSMCAWLSYIYAGAASVVAHPTPPAYVRRHAFR
jgi:hypothetical protein